MVQGNRVNQSATTEDRVPTVEELVAQGWPLDDARIERTRAKARIRARKGRERRAQDEQNAQQTGNGATQAVAPVQQADTGRKTRRARRPRQPRATAEVGHIPPTAERSDVQARVTRLQAQNDRLRKLLCEVVVALADDTDIAA